AQLNSLRYAHVSMTNDRPAVCYNFVVYERPLAVWSLDLAEENRMFIFGIDHTYFSALTDTQVPLLAGDDTRMNAALAIRLTYGHALETFFALLGSAIQAPHCPLAWILSYKPDELRRLIEDVSTAKLKYSRLRSPVSWESLSDEIHRRLPPERALLKPRFAELWRRLASDYVNELKTGEYNSLKHGLRVKAGGFSLKIGPADGTDVPIIDSHSVFGSRFHHRRKLDRYNFSIENAGVNWDPTALAVRVEFLAISTNNVVCFLKEFCAEEAPRIGRRWPEGPENAWELRWEAAYGVGGMRGGRLLGKDAWHRRGPADIRSRYLVEGGRTGA